MRMLILALAFLMGTQAHAKSETHTYVCSRFTNSGDPNQIVVKPKATVEVVQDGESRSYTFVETMGFEDDATLQKRPLITAKSKVKKTEESQQVTLTTHDAKVEVAIPKDQEAKYFIVSFTKEDTQGVCVE